MMKRKLIYPLSILLTIILFLIGTIVFITNHKNTKYHTISYNVYTNVKQFADFKEQIELDFNINFDQVFLKNNGVIQTDETGDIIYIDVDTYIQIDDVTYSAQIQGKYGSDYTIIYHKIRHNLNSKIALDTILNAISIWNFAPTNQAVKFIFNRELINGIRKYDEITQHLFFENSILNVSSDLEGIFGRIIIMHEFYHQEYFFQVE